MISSNIPAHWLTHDLEYIRRTIVLDATAIPTITLRVCKGWRDAILDIADNYKSMSHSFLMILAGKDKLVDNTSGRQFFSKVSTPSDRK
jgi:hypothetical protein